MGYISCDGSLRKILPFMDIYSFLETNGIAYERFDHPAVFTCEESDKLEVDMPGVPTKNLFLRDNSGLRHFLVMVRHEKRVDLAQLKDVLGLSKLSFASPERLQKYLGVEPGSVTLLGLVNDAEKAVEVVIDEVLWEEALQCHPLVNTATLVISAQGIQRFLELTGHKPKVLTVPQRV